MDVKRIARGQLGNENLEKEIDNILKQINGIGIGSNLDKVKKDIADALNRLADTKVASTVEFYAATTSGGAVTTKFTLNFNKYGIKV